MSEYTASDPYAEFFDMQRRAIEQSQRLFHQGVDFQRRSMRMATDGVDSQRSLQRKGTDVARTATEAYFDALEASVPVGGPMFENVHAIFRGQFEATSDLSDRTWDALRAGMEDGTGTYDDLLDDYLAVVDDSVEAYLRTLDEFDAGRGAPGGAAADD